MEKQSEFEVEDYSNASEVSEDRGEDQSSEACIADIINTIGLKQLKLPKYLKNLLVICGFDNIISIANMNDEHIQYLEKFARDDLIDIIPTKKKSDFFGIYCSIPSKFKILEGHKVLLKQFILECDSFLKAEKAELKKINGNQEEIKRKNSRKNSRVNEPQEQISVKKIRLCHAITETSTNLKSQTDILTEPMSEKQFDNISKPTPSKTSAILINSESEIDHVKKVVTNYVQGFCQNMPDEIKIPLLNKLSTIEITVENTFVSIKCIKCGFVSKAFAQINGNKKKWVLSNFNKHFKTHFKDLPPKRKLSTTTEITTKPNSSGNNNLLSFVKVIPFTTPSTSVLISQTENLSSVPENSTAEHSEEGAPECVSYIVLSDGELSSELTEELTISQPIPEQIESLLPENVNHAETETKKDFLCSRTTKRNVEKERGRSSAVFCETPHISQMRRRQINNYLSFDPSQKKITDFFEIVEVIERYTKNQSNLQMEFEKHAFNTLTSFDQTTEIRESNLNCFKFLDILKTTALKNSKSCGNSGNRFKTSLKLFCLYLYLIGGRLMYETLYSNFSNSLPSISTLKRTLLDSSRILEGEIQMNALREYLDKRKYPLRVFVSEDQTAILKRIKYDSKTNKMIGFVIPISQENGFPIHGKFQVNSLQDIRNAFAENKLSMNAYVFMAQPLVDRAPAFCLTIFGSDNKFSSEDVTKRWSYLKSEASKYGIEIDGFASDGDTRCLKSMKNVMELPRKLLSSADIFWPYFWCKFSLNEPVVVQDVIHIGTKLKTRLLNSKIKMHMGKYTVDLEHLKSLIEQIPKDQHLLCISFLNSADKMNFEAVDKISSPIVTKLLDQIKNSYATKQLLIITRYILDAYLEKSLSAERRIYLIWYAVLFLRYWRYWLKQNGYSLMKNFITLNAYVCVEINAHALVLLMEKCREKETPELFIPWLYSSQPCEKMFRQTRSMTTTYSTVVNFDTFDLLTRLTKIQAINDIVSDTGEEFIFPRENNKRLGSNSTVPSNLLMPEECVKILATAKDDVIKDCCELGMILSNAQMDAVLEEGPIGVTSGVSNAHYEEESEDLEADDCETVGETHLEDSRRNASSNIINEPDTESQCPSDIENDLNNMTDVEVLNIRDYKNDLKSSTYNKIFLKIRLNNTKTMVVKKSTLCWLFSEKAGRLSSDRLLRVKGMSSGKSEIISNKRQTTTKKNNLKMKARMKPTTVHKTKKIACSDSESSNSSANSSASESEFESLDESIENSDGSEKKDNILIEEENYYGVFYDAGWYIGRVIRKGDTSSKVKFLKAELDKYIWPTCEDIQDVDNKYIFYGPLTLRGTYPFHIYRNDALQINKKYKNIKSLFK